MGDLTSFEPRLVALIHEAEQLTAANTRLTLTIAANYGGRWDIMQAVNRLLKDHPGHVRRLQRSASGPLSGLGFAPEPDLFIRTGGEQRVSNFCLWQLAYTELYFTETLWPDFEETAFGEALASYRQRERRFGRTSEQLATSGTAVLVPAGRPAEPG